MDRQTIDRLRRINRDFYRARAREFSATRRRAWPGWRRALDVYRARRPRPGGRILDLGCGNGRLGAFVAAELGADHHYLGLDASPALLAEARRFPGAFPGARFAAADLLAEFWPLASRRRADFTWIVAFGIFHHLPGRANRRRFIARLARHLAPGGVATVSFWQFGTEARFLERSVDRAGLDRRRLEPGDHLLRWGSGDEVRYCHHVDDAEAEELAAASGLERVAAYRADGDGGRLNRYLVLATAAPPPPAAGADG